MVEVDIPKRVVFALLFLTIAVSFIGTIAFLQIYASMPAVPPESGSTRGSARIVILSPELPRKVSTSASISNPAVVSVTINRPQ